MGRSGTGLGMAVVWGTVKDHNGYINVSSAPGQGATFELYFPLCRDAVSETMPAIEMDGLMGRGQKILVVDDIAVQRQIGVRILNQLGYAADAVDGGHAAVSYVETHKVDLLVLDMIRNSLKRSSWMSWLKPWWRRARQKRSAGKRLWRHWQNTGRIRWCFPWYPENSWSCAALRRRLASTGIWKNGI
jgi:hypothetical protein